MSMSLKYWVWLSSLAKISPKKRCQLIECFGDAYNIWHAAEGELRKLPFMTQGTISQLIDKKAREEVEKYLEKIYTNGIKVVTIKDSLYPEYLKNIYDPPVVLYIRAFL